MSAHHQRPTGPGLARAAHMYAALLRLYPAAYRQAFGQQMLQTFADHYGDAVARKGESEARFWLGVLGDEGKSLLREYVAALADRRGSMRKLLPAVWEPVTVVAALVLLVLFADASHLPSNTVRVLPGIPMYLALLFLVVRFARSFPLAGERFSWWRLGLLLGGPVGLYVVVLNLLGALAPIHMPADSVYGDDVGPVWLLSLPLLAGVTGVLAGYAGRSPRTGAAAGLLAGGIMLFLQISSMVLLVTALWGPLQAGALHSQLQAGTSDWILHQWSVQHPGEPPSLSTYLTNWNDDNSIAFGVVFESIWTVFAWVIPVILGSAIGARAAQQARVEQRLAVSGQESRHAQQHRSHVRFVALLLVLGLLMWSGYTLVAGPLKHEDLASLLEFLRASFATPAFFAWLFVFVAILAAVYLTVRSRPGRPEAAVRVGLAME